VTLKSRLEITRGHWEWHHSVAPIRFPIGAGPVLNRFRDKARYWSKIDFDALIKDIHQN